MTQERRQWHYIGVFIINFEHISHLVLVFLLLILSKYMPTGNCIKVNSYELKLLRLDISPGVWMLTWRNVHRTFLVAT